jgi:hypothetical protein
MKANQEDRIALIIVIFILVVLVLAAFGINLGDLWTGETLDKVEKLITILGIIVGGIWTYYGFVKGRVYMHRLEPSITGEIVDIGGIKHLLTRFQLKNVGASKITLLSSSGLDIFSDQPYRLTEEREAGLNFESVPWSDPPTTLPVFAGHEWIEPGETIQEEKIIAFRSEGKALLKLELHIDTDRITTSAVTIIKLRKPSKQPKAKPNLFE